MPYCDQSHARGFRSVPVGYACPVAMALAGISTEATQREQRQEQKPVLASMDPMRMPLRAWYWLYRQL